MKAILRRAAIIALFVAPGCSNPEEEAAVDAPRAPTTEAAAGRENMAAPADASGPEAREARGLPRGALRIEPAVILDETGFEAPMAAATLFLPAGWRAEGGVFWGQQFMCTNGYNFNWTATSPDGLSRVAVLPQAKWEQNNYGAPASSPGCQLAPYTNVRQYLEAVVAGARPRARVTGYRVREDLQQEFAQFNSSTPMPMGEARTWVEAGELTATFEEDGRAMEGTVGAVAVFSLMRTDPGTGMGVMDAFSAYTFPAYAATAPAGRLDRGLAEAIRKSIKVNPQWEARIAGHNSAIARTALAEGAKRAKIISETNAEISRIREDAWNSYQESSDRRFREFGEVIRGVETYNDPDAAGGQAELSNLYDHAWRLNDGSYVLTNDASFDPYRALGQDGKKLDAVQ